MSEKNWDNCSNNEEKEDLEYIMLQENDLDDTSYLNQFQLSFNLNGVKLTANLFSTFDPLTQSCSANSHSHNDNNEGQNGEDNKNVVEEYKGVFASQEIEDEINKVQSNVCVLNQEGVIIFTNQSWRQFSNSNGKQDCKTSDLGSNYLHICHQAANTATDDCVRTNAKAFYEGLTRLIDAETTEEFALTYPCDSPTEKRWYLARAFTFHLSGGVQRTIVSHQYISNSDKQNSNENNNNKSKCTPEPQIDNNNNKNNNNNNNNCDCTNEVPQQDNYELNSNKIEKLSGKRSNNQDHEFSQRKLFKLDDNSDNNNNNNNNDNNTNDNENNDNDNSNENNKKDNENNNNNNNDNDSRNENKERE